MLRICRFRRPFRSLSIRLLLAVWFGTMVFSPYPLPSQEQYTRETVRATRIYTLSLVGSLLFPPLAPITLPAGTLTGATMGMHAAQNYRTAIAEMEGSLQPERSRLDPVLVASGATAYTIANLAVLAALLLALDDAGSLRDNNHGRQLAAAGIIAGAGYITGVTTTGIVVWRSRR